MPPKDLDPQVLALYEDVKASVLESVRSGYRIHLLFSPLCVSSMAQTRVQKTHVFMHHVDVLEAL